MKEKITELLKGKEKNPSIITEGKERNNKWILERLNTDSLGKDKGWFLYKIILQPMERTVCFL